MALTYIGTSTIVQTDGSAPGAITPHASTQTGDLLVWFHHTSSTATGRSATRPTGFTSILSQTTASTDGFLAVAYKVRAAGETTYTATITGHTAGTTGDPVGEWIETWRGQDTTTPIGSVSAQPLNGSNSVNFLNIGAPAVTSLPDGDVVVAFAGKTENTTGQTTLTGDSLTWTARDLHNTTLGNDGSAVTQSGLNASGVAQTITNKSISATGTTGTGRGLMFVIKAAAGGGPTPKTLSDAGDADDSITVAAAATSLVPPRRYLRRR